MQEEFVVQVKPAYFDGYETVGVAEYEFSQKLYDYAVKFVEIWPTKKVKMELKAQKTHFRHKKEKILYEIEQNDKKYAHFAHAFERRNKYLDHVAKHGEYDFIKTDRKLQAIEEATAKQVISNLVSTPEMAEFVEERVINGGYTVCSVYGKFDGLACDIVNQEIKKLEAEEKRKEIKPVVDKVLQSSEVLKSLEDPFEANI